MRARRAGRRFTPGNPRAKNTRPRPPSSDPGPKGVPRRAPELHPGEIEQVDDDYPTGMPEDWTWPPGRSDRWGVASGPSERLHEIGAHGVTFPAMS